MKEGSLRKAAHTVWHAQRVKRLVRDRLGGGMQCLVSVCEKMCTDPDCEGPATEIRIVTLGFQEIRKTVHKQISEITDQDVAAFL